MPLKNSATREEYGQNIINKKKTLWDLTPSVTKAITFRVKKKSSLNQQKTATAAFYYQKCRNAVAVLDFNKSSDGAHLVPPLHGPLPPLEQEALLSVRLTHTGRNPPEPLHNLPAVLQGDTGATPYQLDGRVPQNSTM